MDRRLFLIGLAATACGSQATTASDVPSVLQFAEDAANTTSTTVAPTTTTTDTPATSTTEAPTTSTTEAPTTTTTEAPTTTTTEAPAAIPTGPNLTWIATARNHVQYLAPLLTPNGAAFPMPWTQPNPHQFGTPLTLMVTEGQQGDDWVKVQLPIRPNGQEAWVSTADYDITPLFHRAQVNLTTQQVTVWDNGEVIAQTDAVVGSSRTPTPFGNYFVAASVADYFGEPALVLSSFSEALDTFDGGLPVIAIHRTFGAGQESDHNVGSNGCVRVPVETIRFLAREVPLGTPVDFIA